MAAAQRRAEKGKRLASPDPQEEAALNRAHQALTKFQPGLSNGRTLATVAISEWIVARTAMAASVRMNADLMFDLGDSRLRGFVEAALPAIGASIAHLPADKPLFELEPSQVVDAFVAAIKGVQEAAVSANESLGFPFDDEVPF